MIDCAIILAAGENRRMGSHVQAKALLPLPVGTFLSRHISVLTGNGVGKIFVVASRQSADLYSACAGQRTTIVNTCCDRRTGSSVSLLCGLEAVLQGYPQANVMVMDADIIYEMRLMKRVISECADSRLFTIDRASGDTEEVHVYGRGANEPLLIGKGLCSAVTQGLTLLGESLGIIFLAANDAIYCRSLLRWLVGGPPYVNGFGYSGAMSEHEEVWQYLFTLGKMLMGQVPRELLFAECDTPEDYEYIRKEVFPAILERDCGESR